MYKKRNKTFLNDSFDEHGAMSWKVKVDLGYKGDYQIDAEVRMQACYGEPIEWDFKCSMGTFDKRIEKVDTIIREFQALREAMLEAKASIPVKKFYY